MPRRKDTDTVQVGLRVKESLRTALDQAAEKHGISMNAEILLRLEQSFELDALKRELEIKSEYALRAVETAEKHRAEAQARANQLTDFLLQQWPNIRVQPKEEEQDK